MLRDKLSSLSHNCLTIKYSRPKDLIYSKSNSYNNISLTSTTLIASFKGKLIKRSLHSGDHQALRGRI
jgi:hypothetical protein